MTLKLSQAGHRRILPKNQLIVRETVAEIERGNSRDFLNQSSHRDRTSNSKAATQLLIKVLDNDTQLNPALTDFKRLTNLIYLLQLNSAQTGPLKTKFRLKWMYIHSLICFHFLC